MRVRNLLSRDLRSRCPPNLAGCGKTLLKGLETRFVIKTRTKNQSLTVTKDFVDTPSEEFFRNLLGGQIAPDFKVAHYPLSPCASAFAVIGAVFIIPLIVSIASVNAIPGFITFEIMFR